MTTLFDSRLSCRDYASRLLHVGELLEWAKSNRLHLRTTPPIDKDEFIQVENLLCAIERHASNLTPEQALDVVLNDPVLKNDPALQKYSDDIDPVRCLWLIGANAHKKWRELLTSAIAAHELTLLDFGSKLPIHTAPATDTATTAPVGAVSASDGVEPDKAGPLPLTTGDIAFCFAGLRCKTEKEWKDLIGKGRNWVERCLIQPGTRGRGGAPKLWNPVCIGAALVRDGYAKPNSVRAKFQTVHLLQPWLDEWKTYEADNLSADQNTVRTPGVNPGF